MAWTPDLWLKIKPFQTKLFNYIDIEDYLDLDGLMKVIYQAGVADTKAKADVHIQALRDAHEITVNELADERTAAEALVVALEQIEHVYTPRSAREWAHEALTAYKERHV